MVINCCDTPTCSILGNFQRHITAITPSQTSELTEGTYVTRRCKYYKLAPRDLCSALIMLLTFGYILFITSHLKQMGSKVSESSWEKQTSTDSFSIIPGLHYGIVIAFLILDLAVIIMIKHCKNSQLGLLLITE